MLFSKIYNWVKYKTLPPSILFSNRLFVERDSKHRRVTTNLGLTFRNSKWSTYARTNINNNHRTDYLNLLTKILLGAVALIALTSFSSFYSGFNVPSSVYTIMWFIFDSDLYLKVVFSSSLLCISQLTLSSLQRLFYKTLGFPSSAETRFDSELSALSTTHTVPRSLHKPILHRWLTQLNATADLSTLFSESTESVVRPVAPLFAPLYKSVSLLRRDQLSLSLMQSTLPKFSSNNYHQTNLTIGSSSLRSVVLDFTELQPVYKNGIAAPQGEFSQWTLGSIETATSAYPELLKTSSGLFYLTDYSASDITTKSLNVPELSAAQSAVEDQLSVIRWQRWLYKYNILHRAFLRNSTYITQVHKLVNTGFYSDSLASRNTWASQYFTDNEESTKHVQSLYRSMYGNYMGSQNSLSALSSSAGSALNSSNILALDNTNASYHWFIKRFYLFNTLASNSVSLSSTLSTSQSVYGSQQITSVEDLSVLFDSEVSLAINRSPVTSLVGPASLTNVPANVHLNYGDALFFTQTRTEALKNLTKTRSRSSALFFAPSSLSEL